MDERTRNAHWSRLSPMNVKETAVELWSLDEVQSFPVEVRYGKKLDVVRLKSKSPEATHDYVRSLEEVARRLYGDPSQLVAVATCPCCASPVQVSPVLVEIHGAPYVQCQCCSHVFIRCRPRPEVMDLLYTESESHALPYIETEYRIRMEEVVRPKLNWVTATYQNHWNRLPQSILDVGAGGGHFVKECRQRGFDGEGFELSRSSRAFAQEHLGVVLREDDFLGAESAAYDVVTFFGLLEYLPNPKEFLEAARRWLGPNGLLVLEVPRIDSLSAAIQIALPENVFRCLESTCHLNVFSDESLLRLITSLGFYPVAAWYFGMDAFEVLTQLALKHRCPDLIHESHREIEVLQAFCDRHRLCDDIILACALR